MDRPVGLGPNDDDKVIELLEAMVDHDSVNLDEYLTELQETVAQTESDSEPEVFAYAKVMRFLRSGEVDANEMIHLLAAAMWRLHGQNSAEIYVLKADKNVLQTYQETD